MAFGEGMSRVNNEEQQQKLLGSSLSSENPLAGLPQRKNFVSRSHFLKVIALVGGDK